MLYHVCVGIKDTLKEKPCNSCEILKSVLDEAIREKEFFRDLLLTRTGDIKHHETEIELLPENEDFKPVHRGRTLSAIRSSLENRVREYHKRLDATPATVAELTEAEKLFNESLKDTKNGAVQ